MDCYNVARSHPNVNLRPKSEEDDPNSACACDNTWLLAHTVEMAKISFIFRRGIFARGRCRRTMGQIAPRSAEHSGRPPSTSSHEVYCMGQRGEGRLLRLAFYRCQAGTVSVYARD